jgi:hypothetical protein
MTRLESGNLAKLGTMLARFMCCGIPALLPDWRFQAILALSRNN